MPLIAEVLSMVSLQSMTQTLWGRIAIGVGALIVLVLVVRKVTKMNKLILAILVFLGATVIGFNWIYERDEPAWATPVVSKLAGFFPTKDSMK